MDLAGCHDGKRGLAFPEFVGGCGDYRKFYSVVGVSFLLGWLGFG